MNAINNKLQLTVDGYIAAQPENFRKGLAILRNIIKKAVPEATEKMSHSVPCFVHLYMLVGIGVTKKYCSFYTMNTKLVSNFEEDLKGIKVQGSTLYFLPEGPFPEKLIEKIVMARVRENEIRSLARR